MHVVTQYAVSPRSIGVLLQSRNIRYPDSSSPNRPYQVSMKHTQARTRLISLSDPALSKP